MDFTITTAKQGMNQALFQITHGLYILTSKSGNQINGQCLDALMQVTNSPPRIAIGVGKKTLTHEMITASGRFVVNVMDKEDPKWLEKVRHYGFQTGRNINKFADVSYELSRDGIPILPDAKAFYECLVLQELTADLETHTLFVGLVERAGTRKEGEPLTYNEYRRLIKKGG